MYYIHADQLGRPEIITDGSQNKVWQGLNFAFDRAMLIENVSGIDIGLPGQIYDQEMGHWNNGFRDYDASSGRYLQSDPMGLVGGINTYAYVGGNPLSKIDPFGLQEFLFRIGGLLSNEEIVPRPLIEPVKPLPPGTPAPQLPEDFPRIPSDPSQCPGEGWEWRGAPGTKPGDPRGAWYNPAKDWTLHPDIDHPEPIGAHWDWIDENGTKYRISPQAPPVDSLHALTT